MLYSNHSTTLTLKDPVATSQVGCTTSAMTGAAGFPGIALMVTEGASETHPAAFLAVTVYVPEVR